LTASLLAAAGGYLDSFTYLGHGGVFANAMTGNVVLLGINCISGDWRTGLRHLPPIVAFVLGIAVASIFGLAAVERHVRSRYLISLVVEIALLLGLSLLPRHTPNFWITTTIAFAGSVQVATFRKVNGQSYNSTFTTGNLRTLSEGLVTWFSPERKPGTGRLIRDFTSICAAFLAGATAGAFATPRLYNHALWIDVALLLVVLARVLNRSGSKQQNAEQDL
jgi:uncharacterized membrane protein YoaK (UPF0700 family)